jgi:hypothetical protein
MSTQPQQLPLAFDERYDLFAVPFEYEPTGRKPRRSKDRGRARSDTDEK